MSAVHTSLVERSHAWTGDDIPWLLDTEDDALSETPGSDRVRRRLFHCLSSGGLPACGFSNAWAIVSRRQSRFLTFAGVFAALWIIFWIV